MDSIKHLAANILSFYGIGDVEESTDISTPEMLDVIASVSGGEVPDLGVKILGRKPRLSEYYGALNVKSLRYVFFLTSMDALAEAKEKLPAATSLLEKDVYIFPFPSSENSGFEDSIRKLTGNTAARTYFEASEQIESRERAVTPELDSFNSQIASQDLSAAIARRLVYQAAVGGLNIESGRRIRHLGNMISRRNENLSREAIFLEALGILKESEKNRTSGETDEGTVYLTLDQSENTARLAEQIIIETIESKKDSILDIMYSYPEQFSFIVLLGSLGIFAPKQNLPPERAASYKLGVTRTTFESENTFLVETIRDLVNISDITTTEWNRINTLASYPEINNLVHQYFERFEKIGIGVRGHRGIKRIYLPVTNMARNLGLSSFRNTYSRSELKRYVTWDTILNYRLYMNSWQERLQSLGITTDDISQALSETMPRKITSGVLPDGSYMPFAVYNNHAFRNHCIEKMRIASSGILDITW